METTWDAGRGEAGIFTNHVKRKRLGSCALGKVHYERSLYKLLLHKYNTETTEIQQEFNKNLEI